MPAGARLVFCSGQLGIAADGTIPEDVEAQAELIFEAIAAILAEAGMGLATSCASTPMSRAREHCAGYMAVRDEIVGTRRRPRR